jgi:hypothetical protein
MKVDTFKENEFIIITCVHTENGTFNFREHYFRMYNTKLTALLSQRTLPAKLRIRMETITS